MISRRGFLQTCALAAYGMKSILAESSRSGVKITGIETIALEDCNYTFTLVRVRTNTGIDGFGRWGLGIYDPFRISGSHGPRRCGCGATQHGAIWGNFGNHEIAGMAYRRGLLCIPSLLECHDGGGSRCPSAWVISRIGSSTSPMVLSNRLRKFQFLLP